MYLMANYVNYLLEEHLLLFAAFHPPLLCKHARYIVRREWKIR